MKGLTSVQAKQLLDKYGFNEIVEQKKETILKKFLEQFNNFLTIILVAAAALSFFIGEPVDAGLILIIVILNAFFGLYQEAKAEASIAALKKMTVTKVRVVRSNQEEEIDSRYLVPGDVIFIEEGTKIPADAKIVEVHNLEINEAALTGESLPVVKGLNEEIFMGTIVSRGRGYALILKTGMATKFGQIAKGLGKVKESATPLQKKLGQLTRAIGLVGVVAAALVFGLSLSNGSGYFPAFLLAVSLAVAVVPEGLPAVMTITLAIGVREMVRRKSIVRKLSAIESLGGITLIATDKTGTLTTNKMNVKEVFVEGRTYNHELPALSHAAFSQMVIDGVLCSTASLVYVHDHGSYDVLGDPTEGALLFLAQKVGLIPEMLRKEWRIVDEEPFDSVSKRMSVIVENVGAGPASPNRGEPASPNRGEFSRPNTAVQCVKGAPESVITLCDKHLAGRRVEALTQAEKEKIEKQVEEWGKKGLRVLAFAYSDVGVGRDRPVSVDRARHARLDSTIESKRAGPLQNQNMTFLGMVAIHDPPRPEVNEAIKKARQAGIRVVMVTGDNEKTAESIAGQVGMLEEGDEILTGSQLENYTDQELLQIIPRVRIFARTTPFHKDRIVRLFQSLGEVVGVTGDGVNDAIALKQADVGVAMGQIGTDVARETADVVITDDNFATIIVAVEEGRNIIKNLKNAIIYLLSCNLSEAAVLILGLILGLPHIFYPIQFLYINLVTDGLPALSLAFSPRDNNVMERSPQSQAMLLSRSGRNYIFSVSLICSVLVLAVFYFYRQFFGVGVGKTAAFTVLTLTQSFILIDLWLSRRSLRRHYRQLLQPLILAAIIFPFVTQELIVSVPLFASWFKIAPVTSALYLQFVLISGLVLVGIKGVRRMVKA